MASNRQVSLTIRINGKEVRNTLQGVGAEIGRLRSDLRKINESDPNFKPKTEELKKARQRYAEINREINGLPKLMKAASDSFEAQKHKVEQLRKELDNMSWSIVNKMEQYFVVNNIHLNKNFIKLLRSFKNISPNLEMLDIEILLMSQILLINKEVKKEELKKESEEKENIINELGPDLQKKVEQFNKQSSSLIKLSIYKPDFQLFSAKLMMKYFFRRGVKSAHKLKSELKFAMKNQTL